jgi:hypothetical protein
MLESVSLFVVGACTIAGGIRQNLTFPSNRTCKVASRFPECAMQDELISRMDVTLPWIVVLATLTVLGMPTFLVSSKHKERGLRVLSSNLVQYLALLVGSMLVEHPSLAFALTIHSCMQFLVHLNVDCSLVGGSLWWGLRYLAAAGLLAWEVCAGPPLSVVPWPGTPSSVTCSYLGHLLGCIGPGMILDALRMLVSLADYVSFRPEPY